MSCRPVYLKHYVHVLYSRFRNSIITNRVSFAFDVLCSRDSQQDKISILIKRLLKYFPIKAVDIYSKDNPTRFAHCRTVMLVMIHFERNVAELFYPLLV